MAKINHDERQLIGKSHMTKKARSCQIGKTIKVDKLQQDRISQGDIYNEIEYIEYAFEMDGYIHISKIIFPLVIVLTQDCDLAQDSTFRGFRGMEGKTQDKIIISALVAPIYNADHVFAGTHLDDIHKEHLERNHKTEQSMAKINKEKTEGDYLLKNERCRYHYLEFPQDASIVPSIIDFKHYFSVNIEQLISMRKEHFVCRVSDLYREDISLRFANFLSRIGLP
jgi:hypothetical protein